MSWRPRAHSSLPPSAPNLCDLNCLAEGHAFYHSFGRVLDGTPCTPGAQGLCIAGRCLVRTHWPHPTTSILCVTPPRRHPANYISSLPYKLRPSLDPGPKLQAQAPSKPHPFGPRLHPPRELHARSSSHGLSP